MAKVLVAFTTSAGSTEDVAKEIGAELGREGAEVDVRRIEETASIEGYDAVVVGAPMILGWHRAAAGFVKKHRQELAQKRVAYFATAMSLTRTGESQIGKVPIWVDPELAKPPKNEKRLGIKERYATPANYLRPMLQAAPAVTPVSVGFFGGKLELFRLPFLQMLFVMVVIQAQPGDMRNWEAIREWGAQLRTTLL